MLTVIRGSSVLYELLSAVGRGPVATALVDICDTTCENVVGLTRLSP